uniref:Uncharacterized protein n=2 Tax=Leptocylindrus danicus TaxID=163516 RepID=A0A7S2LTV7_9STRA|mmetsp:Transcript_9157/g.13702  ORF Transcript_9157/g.13702 Transcript_9157/m.13702 type:complete len:317 (+) Transcript_9157:3-953(+)
MFSSSDVAPPSEPEVEVVLVAPSIINDPLPPMTMIETGSNFFSTNKSVTDEVYRGSAEPMIPSVIDLNNDSPSSARPPTFGLKRKNKGFKVLQMKGLPTFNEDVDAKKEKRSPENFVVPSIMGFGDGLIKRGSLSSDDSIEEFRRLLFEFREELSELFTYVSANINDVWFKMSSMDVEELYDFVVELLQDGTQIAKEASHAVREQISRALIDASSSLKGFMESEFATELSASYSKASADWASRMSLYDVSDVIRGSLASYATMDNGQVVKEASESMQSKVSDIFASTRAFIEDIIDSEFYGNSNGERKSVISNSNF